MRENNTNFWKQKKEQNKWLLNIWNTAHQPDLLLAERASRRLLRSIDRFGQPLSFHNAIRQEILVFGIFSG